jgi:hypothetical protein
MLGSHLSVRGGNYKSGGYMRGKITIELTRIEDTRDSTSDLPVLGHDAYWFAKQIRELVWTSKEGEEVRMADYYDVTAVRTSTQAD